MDIKIVAVRERGDFATIDSILEAAGADPWSASAVAEHKHSELQKAPPPSRLWVWQPLISRVVQLAMDFSFNIGLVCALGFVAGILMTAFGGPAMLFIAPFCGALCAVLIFCAAWRVWKIKILPAAKWEVRPVSPYDMELPQRARDIMEKVESLLNGRGYDFAAYYLMQDKTVLDPILEITIKNPQTLEWESRSVLVWDKDGTIISPPV